VRCLPRGARLRECFPRRPGFLHVISHRICLMFVATIAVFLGCSSTLIRQVVPARRKTTVFRATSSGVREEERPSQPRAPSTSTPAAGARPLAMAPPVDENSQVSSAVRTAHATVSAAAARNFAKTDTPSDRLTSHG
jgi:hypothetical protein